jgi:dihydroorotase
VIILTAMFDLLIVNALLVNEGLCYDADVLIHAGRIVKIASSIQQSAKQVIDATGHWLLPGMIDDQVHCRDPGLTHKGDIETESRAALVGGITSMLDMPNTVPPILQRAHLATQRERARTVSRINYGCYLGASHDNLDVIKSLRVGEACGIKVFMGASTGQLLVDDPDSLEQIFAQAPILIATHCEHTPTITANMARYEAHYGTAIPMQAHPDIRSAEACWHSSSLAVDLARRHATRLHILHITTKRELALFAAGSPPSSKHITAEACVHHLSFNDTDYESCGTLIKCNPAIKTATDQQALLDAVRSDHIDVIGTDHAPHTWAEKHRPYQDAPSGLPLVQDALPALLEHVHNGQFPMTTLVTKTSHAVADCFAIQERGYIREGYWADLVIVAPQDPYQVEHSHALSRCGWTPFAGRRFQSRIVTTIVNGQIGYHNRQLHDDIRGQLLQFGATRC